jgi:hypothetical protein
MPVEQVHTLVAHAAHGSSDPEVAPNYPALTIDVEICEFGPAGLRDQVEAALEHTSIPTLKSLPGRQGRYWVDVTTDDLRSELGRLKQRSTRTTERVIHHYTAKVGLPSVDSL